MSDVYILAIDLAKRSFQVCATAQGGAVLFNRMVSRTKLEAVLRDQAPCIVAMEACATSHFWGRFAQSLGHEVRLIPPIYVKPFVQRQKNDAEDAAAIAEAALRPNLHYVAVKSAEHQARAVAFRTHQSFVGQRTQLINALRGHLAEFGLVTAQGPTGLKAVSGKIDDNALDIPDAVRDIVRLYLDQIAVLTQKIDELHFKLRAATKVDDAMRRLSWLLPCRFSWLTSIASLDCAAIAVSDQVLILHRLQGRPLREISKRSNVDGYRHSYGMSR
jgi:transposase